MNILFICNQNQHRSLTAESLFKDRFSTDSAGLYNESPVTEEQVSNADIIAVMENKQRTELSKRFPELYLKKRIVDLDIPDTFHKDQPELIYLLESRMQELMQSIPQIAL
ncbi:phosphotyrosine protein phosphatase [Candidatus Woesearchaeota archaeon]|nr:phosphotyrosine protein phosphatase [Candidatus Woesearchaeota archaeon]